MKMIKICNKSLLLFPTVYEPHLDSFMFLKHLKPCKKHLDIGCGSGILCVFSKARIIHGVDINPYALICSKINCLINNINAKIYYSNLFSEVYEKFDLITFNAPYLNEGFEGYEGLNYYYDKIFERFLNEVWDFLNPNGICLFTTTKEGFDYVDYLVFEKEKVYLAYIKKPT